VRPLILRRCAEGEHLWPIGCEPTRVAASRFRGINGETPVGETKDPIIRRCRRPRGVDVVATCQGSTAYECQTQYIDCATIHRTTTLRKPREPVEHRSTTARTAFSSIGYLLRAETGLLLSQTAARGWDDHVSKLDSILLDPALPDLPNRPMLRRSPLALLLVAIVLLPTLAFASPKQRIPIAVTYFANTSNDSSLDVLTKALADMLTTDLSVSDDIVLVEREQLNLALAEIRLQKNPFFDKAGAVRLGGGLGAEFIVTGSFVRLNDQLRIDLKVLDVADGSIVYAVQKSGNDGAIFQLQAELAKALLKELGAKLSRIQEKRLGRGGPSTIRSLKTYGKALEAVDAGKRQDAEQFLREALASDPTFTRVQSRLESLESQVKKLAQSGGLILKPARAEEFLHNYRVHRQRSARAKARESLESAIRLAPKNLDGWLALGSEGTKATMPNNVALSGSMRALLRSYLKREPAELLKRLKGKNATAAAVLLYDLALRDLPSQTLSPYLHVQAAMAHFEPTALASLLADPEEHVESMRQTKRRYFEGKDDGVPGVIAFREGGATLQMGVWRLWVGLDEQPKGPVKVTVARSKHASWNARPRLPPYPEKTRPITKRDLATWPVMYKAIQKARRSKDGFVWLVRHPMHGGTKLVPDTAAKLGDELSLPAYLFACEDSEKSLTGRRCKAIVELTASSLAPGHYDIPVSYSGLDGTVHKNRLDTWFRDIHLHYTELLRRIGTRKLYHRIADLDGKKGLALRKAVKASFVGKRRFPVVGMAHVNTYWRVSSDPNPNDGFAYLQTLFLDIDYKLLGGTAPQTTQQEKAYRDLLVKKGYELAGNPKGHQYIPLPAFDKKPHTVCLVARTTNKALSPEAHCHTFTP